MVNKRTSGQAVSHSSSYFHHDHLGSIAAITDETGAVKDRLAFDPWGKRRFVLTKAGWPDTKDEIVGLRTDRGYTMHEELDEVGAVHMNGRVYDPLIGRFMTADSIVPNPSALQSFNRYGYVFNNPLRYTDPDGHEPWGPGSNWGAGPISGVATTGSGAPNGGYSGLANATGFGAWMATLSEGARALIWTPFNVYVSQSAQISPALLGTFNDQTPIGRASAERRGEMAASRNLEPIGGWESPNERVEGWIQDIGAQQVADGKMLPGFAAAWGALGFRGGSDPKGEAAPKGGRLGSETTRAHIDQVAKEMESRGWNITKGGGRAPEEYLPGPGGARTGSSFPDITATKNGKTLRVNTVDTRSDGITPTTREANNAVRIRAQTGEHLLLVPKP